MDARDPQALFAEICARLHVWPDRDGKVYIACPECGRERHHFRFDVALIDGKEILSGHCFGCGYHASARELIARVGLAPDYVPLPGRRPVVTRPKQADEPKGIFKLSITPDGLAARWALADDVVKRWRAYCPQLTPETIEQRMLGYGVFPRGTSRCMQPRLMMPIFRQDRVVGFRGRLVGPSCNKCQGEVKCARWLSPLGTKPVLYGMEDIVAASHIDLLAICESPVEKLLVDQLASRLELRLVAVATLGVSAWNESWEKVFRRARRVVIAYDNDPPGNGGASTEARAQWFAAHPKTSRDLVCGGARLANRLLAAGCKDVRLHKWGRKDRVGKDLRELLSEHG